MFDMVPKDDFQYAKHHKGFRTIMFNMVLKG